MIVETVITWIILYCLLLYLDNKGSSRYAPGPVRIPPFGNLIQIGLQHKVNYVALHKLAKKYGDVMSVKLGLKNTVIVSSYDAFKTIFTKEESQGRFCEGFMWDRNLKQNIGLGMSEGAIWTETRSFCRDALRNYGFGNRERMRELLLNELVEYFEIIQEAANSNVEGRVHFSPQFFHPIFMNIMATLVLGKRFEYNDSKFKDLLEHEHNAMKNGALGAGIMMAYPFLRHIFPETLGYNTQMKGFRGYHTTAKQYLNDRKTKNYKSIPECFTDEFLKKMDEEAVKTNSFYTEDHFAVCFMDLFQGGTDTTTSVLNFTLLQLLVNPTMQEKVYEEIVNVIGTYRFPELEDKLKMRYTNAVILEGIRWSRVGVFGVPRKASEDFTYRSYEITKGTVIMYNAYSISFDDDYWGDPHVFRPERFLDVDGNIDLLKQEKIIAFAFSTGKRNCFAEAMARDNVFIFVTSFIQRFKFTLPHGETPSLEPLLGISLYAAPYNAIVKRRVAL